MAEEGWLGDNFRILQGSLMRGHLSKLLSIDKTYGRKTPKKNDSAGERANIKETKTCDSQNARRKKNANNRAR